MSILKIKLFYFKKMGLKLNKNKNMRTELNKNNEY